MTVPAVQTDAGAGSPVVKPASAPPRRGWWSRHQRGLAPYLFISPFYLLYGAFLLVPIVVAGYLSLTEWAGFGSPVWVGLRNYQDLIGDPVFFSSVLNTVLYVLISVFVVVPTSLLIATALNMRGLKGRDLFRLVYFTPVVLSPIVVTLVFSLFFDRDFGVLNAILRSTLGVGGIDWLGDPWWARAVVGFLIIWRWTGYLTIFFLAGLQNIPREFYEAAQVDGAGAFRQFWNVTLPLLRPVTAFVAVTVMVGSAQIFDEPYLLTRGGPGDATRSVAMFIYQAAFMRQQLGYAAAAGVLLFAAVFVIGRLANGLLGIGRDQ